ncbi:DUF7446 family protein [Gallibacterium anatis]|uniref:DUF7446 family protein n=1 Tax=Gallibacterium anatis TaxID=750 RepID=UPI00266FF819|nr:hypothetical protein [Gallibacterium anatis]WKS98348.1 hypothetical protein NYR19_06155 [Gallibacterium anatis]
MNQYKLRLSFDNKIVIAKVDKRGLVSRVFNPVDVTIEAIYSVIRHIEGADINNQLITYKEGKNGELIPEYKLTLEKLEG